MFREEYPRPQFKREDWMNLNGEWRFTYDDEDSGINEKWFNQRIDERRIQVPFAYQTKLSGIHDTDFHDIVWYQREIEVPKEWSDRQLMIHFGAVDYTAHVWVNGELVAVNHGGHTPFSCDITNHCLIDGKNTVTVRCEDITHDVTQPRGKQYWKEESEGIFYTRTTGIWQTVWLEPVNKQRIDKVKLTPDIDLDTIQLDYHLQSTHPLLTLEVEISFNGDPVAKDRIQCVKESGSRAISLNDFNVHNQGRLWSPKKPNLYDMKLKLTAGEDILDEVDTYFGMRKVSVGNGKVLLNNRPYYMKLVLDQGYFEESLLTPPSDQAIQKDIDLTKSMGFNGVRKHQKVEDPRYLYWADKKGLLVWGEMANSYMYSSQSVQKITDEWQRVIERDYNHPCIVAWVPLNESWGTPNLLSSKKQQSHSLTMYHLTKSLDDTRLVMSNDGWEHTQSDLCTIHDYEAYKGILLERYADLDRILKAMPGSKCIYVPGFNYNGEPIHVTEFGGIAYKKSDWEGWGYSGAVSDEEFIERYHAVVSALLESPLVDGFCYTQLTDVEQEINGLLTYDRTPKVDLDIIKRINDGVDKSRFRIKG